MTKKANSNLHKAKAVKNDEFYTQLTDIEKEVKNYREHFKGKTVLCNCDDPEWSNFWRFFSAQFSFLGLKKLISTHYEANGSSYYLEITGDTNGDGRIDGDDLVKKPLSGNGDFRSPECVEILKEADIVVSNPPFSLFREYVDLLVSHNKQFLIVGSYNAVTYKEIFKLIKANKLWLGFNMPKEFKQPDGTIKKFGNIAWFTNLEHGKRNLKADLFWQYVPEDYPKYDNYDAIEVSKVCRIPSDYTGYMGVPITFLQSYNPEQFEIVSSNDCKSDRVPSKEHGLIKDKDSAINGKPTYVRIVIKHRNPEQRPSSLAA